MLMVRFSYYDMKMFMQILNSLPKQMFKKKENITTHSTNFKQQINKLTTLGFSTQDCIKALEICEMKLDDAALWLTQNAVSSYTQGFKETEQSSPLSISSVEVCIIYLLQ